MDAKSCTLVLEVLGARDADNATNSTRLDVETPS